MTDARTPFGLWSGIGLVVANMIGVGVFLSTGFMAQSMAPGTILLAWGVGTVLALAGARAYGEVATLVPESGGEYRYLSTLLHPALGSLAGWASLLVGFSAPIAADALGAGDYAQKLFPAVDPLWFGAALVVLITALHAVGLHVSARAQNALVVVKVLLLTAFLALGLFAGHLGFPTWVPPSPAKEPVSDFVGSLFYIAFAFSGWNAAVYAASEFTDAKRTVPRAMVLGCGLVAALYLLLNYVFVANLTPEQLSIVFRFDSEKVTVGHALALALGGPVAAQALSGIILLAFISAMSAMTLVGPRVYAAMAKDGVLPRALAGKDGKPPTLSVLLQGVLALAVLFTHTLQEVLKNVGAILVLFAALTVAGLFWAGRRIPGATVKPIALVCAAVYLGSAAVMLYFGFLGKTHLLWWVGGVALVALLAWAASPARRRPA
ncbi:MAG: amino acid permease [Myxococcaceae bacterium]|nr:amino acid permease [Myxococcaceae bacterium]